VPRRSRRLFRARSKALGRVADGADATARLDALARAWSSMRDGARACAVTCGEAGSWWLTREGAFHVPAPPSTRSTRSAPATCSTARTRSRSRTARGSATRARFATHAAALKCMRDGGRAGAPTRDEVDAFVARLGAR
jgi:sulfofructose kinase